MRVMPWRAFAPCRISRRTISGERFITAKWMGPVLVAIRHCHVGKFRPRTEHCPYPRQIVRAYGFGQAPDGHAVHKRLEFGPAVKAVASGKHQLRVVQREFRSVGGTVMRVDFGDGLRIAGGKPAQQLFRLMLQLFEIRMLPHPAGG